MLRHLVARRDPRQGKFLTVRSVRWALTRRAYTRWHLRSYWRFMLFKIRHPHVITEGLVFLGRNVSVEARPGHGRIILGRWVHLGDGCAIRAHEGTLRIGDKCVIGRETTINTYLDIDIGATTIIGDWVYICDFDHKFSDLDVPIKDQGIVKSPVRIGGDCWLGTKVSVLRGSDIGDGSVVAAHAVVREVHPPLAVLAGVPARVVSSRSQLHAEETLRQQALADTARKIEQAALQNRAAHGTRS